jgi:hypothetical protein
MSLQNLEFPNEYNIFTGSLSFGEPAGSAFQAYQQTGYTSTLTGPYAAPVGPVTGLYRQIDRTFVISVSGTVATASIAAPITLTTPCPHIPYTNLYFPIWVVDNGSTVAGTLEINTSGIMTIYTAFNSNFSGSGSTGFQSFSVSFPSYL